MNTTNLIVGIALAILSFVVAYHFGLSRGRIAAKRQVVDILARKVAERAATNKRDKTAV